jgi:polyphosphate kinase 2 (PPK2 family)
VEINMFDLKFQQENLNENVRVLKENNQQVIVILEGRDSAGKSGTIRELTHFLPTDDYHVITTKKPSAKTMDRWLDYWLYLLEKRAETIIFCDRSWYSRPLVQSVNGWCTDKQRKQFMREVDYFERYEMFPSIDIKFWLSISQKEQNDRLSDRKTSKLRGWKYSENDARALSNYDKMTLAKEKVFTAENQEWNVIDYNDKRSGRLDLLARLNELLENRLP